MNQSDKKLITQYSKQILCAGEYSYIRNVPKSVLERFEELYNQALGTDMHNNFSCASCTLNFLKLFYKYTKNEGLL